MPLDLLTCVALPVSIREIAIVAHSFGGSLTILQAKRERAIRALVMEIFKAPAVEAGAKSLARESPVDFTGRMVSHYPFSGLR
jgi:hypothetical protein